MMLTHFRELVQGSWRYVTGLRSFLSVTLAREEAERMVQEQLASRDEGFLRVLELGVYANPRSPYRRLLLHAGFQFKDVESLVRERGLEGAMARLYDAGVYVTLDEFKGRAPIRRPGLEFKVSQFDFDNPLLTEHYAGSTSGSRGGGTRVAIDFDFFAFEAAEWLCDLYSAGDAEMPQVLWHRGPPGTMGLRSSLILARLGRTPPKWFSPSKPLWNRQGLQGRAMIAYTRAASRLFGKPLPAPKYAPEASELVPYLADAVRRGKPVSVHCTMSPAVRICLAAEKLGADIRGTRFRSGGEPYTEGKAAVINRVGARLSPGYAMFEAGTISLPCGAPTVADDMHILSHRLVVLHRPLRLPGGVEVQSLIHTSLVQSSPKLMLNVESGDYGVVEERDCGCPWYQRGFKTHLHSVRSYEKLTSDGVMFMGSMLYELLEETLPARFGGSVTDYQFVEEEEEDGLPRVSVVISPRVGPLDEAAVLNTVVESLSFADWSRSQAELWRQEGTLRVDRREPLATMTGKILPLHVLASAPASQSNESRPK
jgi:hypothetical protein